MISTAKRLKAAVRRRKQDHGLEKGRFVGLYRHDPLRRQDNVLAIMQLHLAPGESLRIMGLDICKNDPSRAEAILYRRYLLACAEALAQKLRWGNGRVEWEPSSEKEAKLLRKLDFQPRPVRRGSRLRRRSILFRDPR